MLQSIVLRNRRQTKSLVSSAAGECLCGRFSLTELTKQAMLPLLLGVEQMFVAKATNITNNISSSRIPRGFATL